MSSKCFPYGVLLGRVSLLLTHLEVAMLTADWRTERLAVD